MRQFNEFYSFENFSNNFNLNKKRLFKLNNKQIITAEEKLNLSNHKKNFFMAIINFLQTNLKEQNLKINNIKKHTFVFNRILDKVFSLQEHSYSEREINYLGYLFKNNLFQELSKQEIESNEPFLLNVEIYLNFCDYISKGNFSGFALECNNEDCQNCSKNLILNFINWQPILETYNESENTDCISKEITTVNFEIKSPTLLIADWFRINEFTDQVEYNPDYLLPSINTYKGRVLSTLSSIKNGFISIHVGNSSPSIFIKENNLYCIESCDSDNKLIKKSGFNYKGYVCTDLWNVTLIEKSVLIEIIKRKNPNAEQIVDDYISQNSDDIIKLNVQPGEYKLEFHGDSYKFHKEKKLKLGFKGELLFSLYQVNQS